MSLISCTKDNEELESENNNVADSFKSQSSLELYNSILEIDDFNEQKQAVMSYSTSVQAQLWQHKLANFENNNTLTEQQAVFIDTLQVLMTASNMDNIRSETPNPGLVAGAARLQTEAVNLFGQKEGWYLLNRFENINQTLTKSNFPVSSISTDSITDCDCNSDSDCWRITGIAIWGVTWERGECTSATCYQESWFWGLWESSDNMICSF